MRRIGVSPGQRGFTLIELLVVIAIIGILIKLLLPVITLNQESQGLERNISEVGALLMHPIEELYSKDTRLRVSTTCTPVSMLLMGITLGSFGGLWRGDPKHPRHPEIKLNHVSAGGIVANRYDGERDHRRNLSHSVQTAIDISDDLKLSPKQIQRLKKFQSVFDRYLLNLESEQPDSYSLLVDVVWLLKRYIAIRKILVAAKRLASRQ